MIVFEMNVQTPAHERESRVEAEAVPNRYDDRFGVVTVSGLAGAQQGAPHGARVADELRALEPRAQRRGQRPRDLFAEAIDMVKRLANADRRNVGEHAEVAGKAEAVGMQDSVAVD